MTSPLTLHQNQGGQVRKNRSEDSRRILAAKIQKEKASARKVVLQRTGQPILLNVAMSMGLSAERREVLANRHEQCAETRSKMNPARSDCQKALVAISLHQEAIHLGNPTKRHTARDPSGPVVHRSTGDGRPPAKMRPKATRSGSTSSLQIAVYRPGGKQTS